MTVLLVLFMLVLFLAADYFVQKAHLRKERPAATYPVPDTLQYAPGIPAGVALASNHLWVKAEPEGYTTIGLDEFLGTMLGTVEKILLPSVGSALDLAETSITVRDGTRALRLALPMGGKVVQVNADLLKNPSLVRRDPYGAGWLIKIQPADSPQHVYMNGRGVAWLKEQMNLAKEFLMARMPQPAFATMLDGGRPVDGLLKNCPDQVWNEFQEKFVTLQLENEGTGKPSC